MSTTARCKQKENSSVNLTCTALSLYLIQSMILFTGRFATSNKSTHHIQGQTSQKWSRIRGCKIQMLIILIIVIMIKKTVEYVARKRGRRKREEMRQFESLLPALPPLAYQAFWISFIEIFLRKRSLLPALPVYQAFDSESVVTVARIATGLPSRQCLPCTWKSLVWMFVEIKLGQIRFKMACNVRRPVINSRSVIS